ncbi:MAG: hypothetical protein P9L99_17725 [Candidatus Lernaella stagnicola]|nr:hypothetical protein [Candidatus Lernaella stagnicola]
MRRVGKLTLIAAFMLLAVATLLVRADARSSRCVSHVGRAESEAFAWASAGMPVWVLSLQKEMKFAEVAGQRRRMVAQAKDLKNRTQTKLNQMKARQLQRSAFETDEEYAARRRAAKRPKAPELPIDKRHYVIMDLPVSIKYQNCKGTQYNIMIWGGKDYAVPGTWCRYKYWTFGIPAFQAGSKPRELSPLFKRACYTGTNLYGRHNVGGGTKKWHGEFHCIYNGPVLNYMHPGLASNSADPSPRCRERRAFYRLMFRPYSTGGYNMERKHVVPFRQVLISNIFENMNFLQDEQEAKKYSDVLSRLKCTTIVDIADGSRTIVEYWSLYDPQDGQEYFVLGDRARWGGHVNKYHWRQ